MNVPGLMAILGGGGNGPFVKPISKAMLRKLPLRGNFGGQVLPGLNLSTHNSLFDPMIPWYSVEQQAAIFVAKRAVGLNVINLCSWSDYHGGEFGMPISYEWTKGAAGAQLARAYCIGLRNKGFLPAFWLLGDRFGNDLYDPNGGHCDDALELIWRILPAIKDVVGMISPGYEIRGCCGAAGAPYSAAQYFRMLLLMNEIAPDVYKVGHFASENSAGSSHSPDEAGDPWHSNEIGFWTETDWPGSGSTLLDACFYQAPTGNKLFGPAGDWKDRWQEMIDRLGAGNHIWPPACTNVDLLWGEAGWYDITRGDNTEQQLQAVSAQALAMGGKWSFSG